MLTTTTPTRSRTTPPHPQRATAPRVSALRVALDDAHAQLDAALADLRALVSHARLGADDAAALEAEYAERYLHRVAALEERGALACTADEWQRFTAIAVRRTAARRGAAARRDRARDAAHRARLPRRGARGGSSIRRCRRSSTPSRTRRSSRSAPSSPPRSCSERPRSRGRIIGSPAAPLAADPLSLAAHTRGTSAGLAGASPHRRLRAPSLAARRPHPRRARGACPRSATTSITEGTHTMSDLTHTIVLVEEDETHADVPGRQPHRRRLRGASDRRSGATRSRSAPAPCPTPPSSTSTPAAAARSRAPCAAASAATSTTACRSCCSAPSTASSTSCAPSRPAPTITSPSRSATPSCAPAWGRCCAAPTWPGARGRCAACGRCRSTRPSGAWSSATRVVELSCKEFALLCTLASDPTRVFAKQQLLRDLWGFSAVGRTRTLDSHACRLRAKLGVTGERFVINVWGVGYRLVDGSVADEATAPLVHAA